MQKQLYVITTIDGASYLTDDLVPETSSKVYPIDADQKNNLNARLISDYVAALLRGSLITVSFQEKVATIMEITEELQAVYGMYQTLAEQAEKIALKRAAVSTFRELISDLKK